MKDIASELQTLCHALRLGELIGEPEAVSGGLIHKLYAITTSKGKYAVKVLNPQIMERPTAKQNVIRSEQIASRAADVVSALPAIRVEGRFLHEGNNAFYLVFDWVDGISLKPSEVTVRHCEEMGALLADLHQTDFSGLAMDKEEASQESTIDWTFYLQRGREARFVWVTQLQDAMEKLYEWNALANHSASLLEADRVFSHRDLEPKNVMWTADGPVIIDWESAGSIHPLQDLTETAFYWSREDGGTIDKDRFLAFLQGYQRKIGPLAADWNVVLATGFRGRLAWLEYSLNRSLFIECSDAEEQQLGTEQVIGTLYDLIGYAARSAELETWLNELQRSTH
ncbi:phosphotransferase [Gorillibacterium sp. CAU 1737]|uniref:phosphotransferase n=1 Tax=Gorillibacterium sp. CAU 1737 TaxID=3140362 RepID=UPI003261A132